MKKKNILQVKVIKINLVDFLHAKNQREISKNEARSPPPTLFMEMWTFPFYSFHSNKLLKRASL